MTRDDAVTEIKSSTGHDADDQATTAQIQGWLEREYKRIRRLLIDVAPTLYTATHTTQVLTSSSTTYTLPSDFERIRRFERLFGDTWLPIMTSDGHTIHTGALNFREEAGGIQVAPALVAAGSYRLIYHQIPSVAANYNITVPDGVEDVITERVCARVRVRLEEDRAPNFDTANGIWAEQKAALKRRYGIHPVPGLVRARGDT